MNKQQLLTALNEERAKFLKSIEGLSNEQMTEKGVIDDWSIKDMLAHIATWESEMVTFIAQLQQGKKPRTNLMSDKVDALNAEFYKNNKIARSIASSPIFTECVSRRSNKWSC